MINNKINAHEYLFKKILYDAYGKMVQLLFSSYDFDDFTFIEYFWYLVNSQRYNEWK